MDAKYVNSLYNIYNNICRYIENIGSETVEHEVLNKSEFTKYVQFNPFIKIKTQNIQNPEETIYIFLIIDNTLVTRTQSFIKLLNNVPGTRENVTIISKDELKKSILKSLIKYKKKDIKVKSLSYIYFKVDVRNHIMVPKHVLCSEVEKKNILSEMLITSHNMLPKIKITDPQVVWLNAKIGDVILITRNDITGPVLYYRLVV